MNKIFFTGVALCVAFAFTSCKSSESAYKKAYEKAMAAQNMQGQQDYYQQQNVYGQQQTPVQVTPVTPTTTAPVQQQQQQQTTVVATPDYSNVAVRTENVTVVSGGQLNAYSVVVGSFSVKSNAEALRTKLATAGYTSLVVKAMVNGSEWYRVVAGTFGTKNEAAAFRAAQQGTYPDAWLLYSK